MEKNINDENARIHRAYELRKRGLFDESYAAAEKISPSMPGYAALMGWHLMRVGKFLEGFTLLEHEIGIYRADATYNLPKEKRFVAGMELRGKKILYALEGGFGDEIAYARFAPLVEARGAKVVVGASPRLASAISRMSSAPETINIQTVDHNSYDCYIPAMSAIALLQITDPKAGIIFPYLMPLSQEVMQWKPVLDEAAQGKKKIGIHWQGNWEFDYLEQKSPPAKEMLRLTEVGKLFSLQRDAGNNQLPENNLVFDSEAGAPSWERTLAVIHGMDYIVTNDTSTAHLSGALGKKTLVLLPHAPHQYWLPLQHESLWYPNMYCFRQPKPGDWTGAVDAALACLQNDTI